MPMNDPSLAQQFPPRAAAACGLRSSLALALVVALLAATASVAWAAPAADPDKAPVPTPGAGQVRTAHHGGESSLVLPDLGQASFLGMSGYVQLGLGLVVCLAGLGFGLWVY